MAMLPKDPVPDGSGVLDEALKRRLKAMPKRQQPDHDPPGAHQRSHAQQSPEDHQNDQDMELRGQGLRSDI